MRPVKTSAKKRSKKINANAIKATRGGVAVKTGLKASVKYEDG